MHDNRKIEVKSMGFAFRLLYVTLSYLFPAELYPELTQFHLTLAVGILGAACIADRNARK